MRDAGKLNLNSPTPIRRKTEPYARQVLYSDRRFGKLGDMSSSSPFLQVECILALWKIGRAHV